MHLRGEGWGCGPQRHADRPRCEECHVFRVCRVFICIFAVWRFAHLRVRFCRLRVVFVIHCFVCGRYARTSVFCCTSGLPILHVFGNVFVVCLVNLQNYDACRRANCGPIRFVGNSIVQVVSVAFAVFAQKFHHLFHFTLTMKAMEAMRAMKKAMKAKAMKT